MNKVFDYEFGKIAVTLNHMQVMLSDMKPRCLVDITECVETDGTSTMDQEELGKYIEFLQGVRNEMIQADTHLGGKK
ncbi:hypothetical protein ACQGSH_22400 [Bacillus wiedmannii]|uniref:hypothetical protein n=1 Tax=Bacillus wiedmannii TaxID=1890302 RepID=UPI001F08D571|nr:hypothetical protein [Bacillus wiedmannii]MCX3317552.1 hypothetical protein [Bacillus wiedmannii]